MCRWMNRLTEWMDECMDGWKDGGRKKGTDRRMDLLYVPKDTL